MTQEELLEKIMEAVESEPEADYGNASMNEYIRIQGIRAQIYDLLEEYNAQREESDD